MVVFAITATALLASVGLLYSFGWVLAERRTLQTAADAASLRGAWQVLSELQTEDRLDSNVFNVVRQYAAGNGVTNPTDVSGLYVDAAGVPLGTALGCGCAFPPSARGVQVRVQATTPTLLPGFVGVPVTVAASAIATAKTTASPTSETMVLPVGVYIGDYGLNTQIDLFAPRTAPSGQPPTLDLRGASVPAAGHGPMSNNLQFWSDGQDDNGTVLAGVNLPLAGSTAYDSIAAGLADNVRRQNLRDASGAAYAIVTIALWDSSSAAPAPGSIHVSAFARLKIKATDIHANSVLGRFVPYAPAAFGVLSTGSPDYGAGLVRIAS